MCKVKYIWEINFSCCRLTVFYYIHAVNKSYFYILKIALWQTYKSFFLGKNNNNQLAAKIKTQDHYDSISINI